MKTFKKICRKEQYTLKAWLEKLLKAKYKNVVNGDGYLYAKGDGKSPLLLTAHMDTVHKDRCKDIVVKRTKEGTTLWSPQGIGGDDRCGIWIIYMVLTKTKYRPSILFCEDEEIGGVGSGKFCDTDYIDDLRELKYLVELDRANPNDAVFYDCDNQEFQDYIMETTGYEMSYGSFSDIGHLSPACDKASVNLSCGYYNAHTLKEYVVYEEMFNTFKTVKTLLNESKECEEYDYQEYQKTSLFEGFNWDWYNRYYGSKESNSIYSLKDEYFEEEEKQEDKDDISLKQYEFQFNTPKGEDYVVVEAYFFEEAVGMFLMDNPTVCWNDVIDYTEYQEAS